MRIPIVLTAIVLCSAVTSARAANTTTNLSVSATVLPSCEVSAGAQAASGSAATSACSNLGDGEVVIRIEAAEKPRIPRPADQRPMEPAADDKGVTFITITY